MRDYEDDSSIESHFELWRRIPPKLSIFDKNLGATSAAFDNDSDGEPMSILIGAVMAEHGLGSADALHEHPGYALAYITAGLARECEQKVPRDALANELAHGVVVGWKPHSTRKKLAKASVWVVAPRLPES